MSEQTQSNRRFPWLLSSFDLEGYIGAIAALVIGLLLSWLWSPLFLIGLFGAVMFLLATRRAERTPPEGNNLILAPTDGIVVSVQNAIPPSELRLPDTQWKRVRVSSAPNKTNQIFAPIEGVVTNIIRETGDPSVFMAMSPDRQGLTVLNITLQNENVQLGIRLATGGLGPRLDLSREISDPVRFGRSIGKLRLGGWCDIYLPADLVVLPRPGQTLIGAETCLVRQADDELRAHMVQNDETGQNQQAEIVPDEPVGPVSEEAAAEGEAGKDEAEPVNAEDALTLEKIAGAVKRASAKEDSPATDKDVAAMFDRLRKEVRKNKPADESQS